MRTAAKGCWRRERAASCSFRVGITPPRGRSGSTSRQRGTRGSHSGQAGGWYPSSVPLLRWRSRRSTARVLVARGGMTKPSPLATSGSHARTESSRCGQGLRPHRVPLEGRSGRRRPPRSRCLGPPCEVIPGRRRPKEGPIGIERHDVPRLGKCYAGSAVRVILTTMPDAVGSGQRTNSVVTPSGSIDFS